MQQLCFCKVFRKFTLFKKNKNPFFTRLLSGSSKCSTKFGPQRLRLRFCRSERRSFVRIFICLSFRIPGSKLEELKPNQQKLVFGSLREELSERSAFACLCKKSQTIKNLLLSNDFDQVSNGYQSKISNLKIQRVHVSA